MKIKHYIPFIGVVLAIWGLVTLDWFKLVFGIVLYLGSFLQDYFKKRSALKDDKVFSGYKTLTELIRGIRKAINSLDSDFNNPKGVLIQALFFTGIIDATSQALNMSDKQFIDLYNSIFIDLDDIINESLKLEILSFHQNYNVEITDERFNEMLDSEATDEEITEELIAEHEASDVILAGREVYSELINENTLFFMVSANILQEFLLDPEFPDAI